MVLRPAARDLPLWIPRQGAGLQLRAAGLHTQAMEEAVAPPIMAEAIAKVLLLRGEDNKSYHVLKTRIM